MAQESGGDRGKEATPGSGGPGSERSPGPGSGDRPGPGMSDRPGPGSSGPAGPGAPPPGRPETTAAEDESTPARGEPTPPADRPSGGPGSGGQGPSAAGQPPAWAAAPSQPGGEGRSQGPDQPAPPPEGYGTGQAYPGQGAGPEYPGYGAGQGYPGYGAGQGYPGYGRGQQYAPAPSPAGQPNAGSAVAVAVLGIGSLVVLFTCAVGFIPAIIALVMAPGAEREIAQSGGRLGGLGLVRAGKICAWITLGITGLVLVLAIIGIVVLALLVDGGAGIRAALGA